MGISRISTSLIDRHGPAVLWMRRLPSLPGNELANGQAESDCRKGVANAMLPPPRMDRDEAMVNHQFRSRDDVGHAREQHCHWDPRAHAGYAPGRRYSSLDFRGHPVIAIAL